MSDTDSAGQEGANPGDTGQANSPDNSQSEVISALEERLKNAEGQLNSLRSEKDKSVVKTNQRLSDFEQKQNELVVMQGYLEKYGSPEDAARQMAIDAMLQGDPNPEESQQSNSNPEGQANQDGAQAKENNLVPLLLGTDGEKDPAYVALVGTGLSPNDAAIQVANTRFIAAQQGDPNAASGIAGGTAGAPAQGAQQSVLESQYQEQLKNIPQGDWRAVSNLKDTFRKQGLEKW